MNSVYLKAINHFKEVKEGAYLEIADYYKRIIWEDISSEIVIEKKITEIDSDIIFSTSTGVYVFNLASNKLIKILNGKYYGLTKWGDWWITTRSNNKGYRDHLVNRRISDFCKFKLDKEHNIIEWELIIIGIPGEVHQIDVFKNILYIPHTDFNQILTLDLNLLKKSIYPITLESGLLKSIKVASNLSSHFNSIFVTSKEIFILAHNFTMYTKKWSELIILNEEYTQKLIPLNAHSAHNIIKISEDLYYCDSNHYKLYKKNQPVFSRDKLLRGLSISNEYIYVGGSDICFEQKIRYSSNPSIYILDKRTNKLLAEIMLKSIGDLYEIRQLTNIDYSLSINSQQ